MDLSQDDQLNAFSAKTENLSPLVASYWLLRQAEPYILERQDTNDMEERRQAHWTRKMRNCEHQRWENINCTASKWRPDISRPSHPHTGRTNSISSTSGYTDTEKGYSESEWGGRISDKGFITKSRSCMRGCGIVSSSV